MMRKLCLGIAALLLLGALGLPAASLGAGPRAAPVADAGPDQTVNVNDTVHFDGSGSSDPDGDALTYSWDFDRSNGIQRDATGANVSHVYSVAGVYRVTLTVSDGLQVATDECNVTVTEAGVNHAPTAVISEPRNGALKMVNTAVAFDGSNSTDPEKDKLTYAWDFGDGGTGTGAKTTHTYKAVGIMIANLTVSDGKLTGSASVYVNIVAVPGVDFNRPPKADAGANQTGYVKELLYFTSMSTDVDNDKLKYNWDFDQANGVNILKPDIATDNKTVTWSYNATGNYTVTHWVQEVNTTEHYIAFATCWANISDYPKYPPLAEAGPNQTVTVDTEVTLTGSGMSRNPGGSIKQYAWDFENDGTLDWYSNTTGKVKHTYTAPRAYTARFRVVDETGATAEDLTTITVNPKPNLPPTADAGGDQTVFASQPVTFHGSGSDPDGQVVKYQWDYNGDGVWEYENPSSGTGSYTYASPGTFDAKLRVTDNGGAAADATAVVTVKLKEPPVANAGGDQAVSCGETVTFDGSASKDPDGQKLTFAWDFDDQNGVQVDATGAIVEHVYTKGGDYTATLTVTDEFGKTAKDTALVSVAQAAGATLRVSPPSKSLKPGEEGAFYLTLQNTGNGRDGFSLLLSGDNYRWGSLDMSEIALDAGASATLVLRASPPVDAAAGSQAKITIRAASAFDPNTAGTTQVTVTVGQVFGVGLVPDKTKAAVDTGKSISFNVRVTNNGNGDDRVTVKLGGAAAKWATVTPGQAVITKGLIKTYSIKLGIPGDAAAQDYMLTATAYSQDNLTISSAGIMITVNKGPAGGFIPGFGAGVMLVAIMAGAAAIVLRRRN